MSRKLILLVLAVVVTGAVVWWASAGYRRGWTTHSQEALAELDLGLEAQAKVYHEEAREHFAKALHLDPSFAVAKLFLLLAGEKASTDTAEDLLDELRRVDLETLTPRERFLLRYNLASMERRQEEAASLLRQYVAAVPDDPFALNYQGRKALEEQDWGTAQKVYERLIEVAPNRVEAYNELGYLAMAQERFQDSENMFRTYHYLAPDQANPRDSLGELLALTGRYDEAEREFYGALAAKPDFCVSYEHLLQMSFLDLNTDRVDRAMARAAQATTCSPAVMHELSCLATLVRATATKSWENIWQAGLGPCERTRASGDHIRFHAAVWTGRSAEAETWKVKVGEAMAKRGAATYYARWLERNLIHLEGVRLLASGQGAQAATNLATADRGLAYRGLSDGMFKLLNRLNLQAALQVAGDRAAADTIGKEITRVNPFVIDAWREVERPGSVGPTPSP